MADGAYGLLARVYDRLMEEMPYRKWLRFLAECFARYGKPERIVDLGCGTGNLAIPLAQAGYRVLGIDLSEDMLAVARRKAEGVRLPAGGALAWSRQDMRSWQAEEPADCVFSFCDCLNYVLDEDGIRRVFRQTFAGLRPGGLFAFDVHAPARMPVYAEEQPYVWDEDGLACIWTCEYDPDRILVEHRLTFFVREEAGGEEGGAGAGPSPGEGSGDRSGGDGRYARFREVHRQRAYMPDFLSDELRRAGFTVLDRCADFGWHPPDDESERLFFVARKPF
jgi:SAM-dependent methyltransferase